VICHARIHRVGRRRKIFTAKVRLLWYLLGMKVRRQEIRRVCAQIARLFQPERIVLFGSYAYGRPTADSDVDLFVVMPFDGKGFRKASEIRSRIDADFPLDLVVRTPEEVSRRLAVGDSFLREITRKGELLYVA
jgi:predicted nucleotidyltransferase